MEAEATFINNTSSPFYPRNLLLRSKSIPSLLDPLSSSAPNVYLKMKIVSIDPHTQRPPQYITNFEGDRNSDLII